MTINPGISIGARNERCAHPSGNAVNPLPRLRTRIVASLVVFIAASLAYCSSTGSRAPGVAGACPDLSTWVGSKSADGSSQWSNAQGEHVSWPVHAADSGIRVFDASLTSPPIVVPADGLEFSFAQQLQLSWANSAGVLEIDVPGNGWVDILAAGGRFSEGTYNARSYGGNPIGMRRAWGGTLPPFVTRGILPEAARDKVIRLRFRFASGGTGDIHPGWRLRDLTCG